MCGTGGDRRRTHRAVHGDYIGGHQICGSALDGVTLGDARTEHQGNGTPASSTVTGEPKIGGHQLRGSVLENVEIGDVTHAAAGVDRCSHCNRPMGDDNPHRICRHCEAVFCRSCDQWVQRARSGGDCDRDELPERLCRRCYLMLVNQPSNRAGGSAAADEVARRSDESAKERTMGPFCTNCGHHLGVEARFCTQCGAAVEGAPQERTERVKMTADAARAGAASPPGHVASSASSVSSPSTAEQKPENVFTDPADAVAYLPCPRCERPIYLRVLSFPQYIHCDHCEGKGTIAQRPKRLQLMEERSGDETAPVHAAGDDIGSYVFCPRCDSKMSGDTLFCTVRGAVIRAYLSEEEYPDLAARELARA